MFVTSPNRGRLLVTASPPIDLGRHPFLFRAYLFSVTPRIYKS